jgi:hypothetical protein
MDAAGAFATSFDQGSTLGLLLAASAAQQQHHNGSALGNGAAGPRAGHKADLFAAPAPAGSAAGSPGCYGGNGYDTSMIDAEEPGPLPILPRSGRTLSSGGPYGSSAAALMMQQQHHGGGNGASSNGASSNGGYHAGQQQHQPQAGAAAAGMRPARPRRHSVTLGMLNEHQQQQQAAAYAAAISTAQQQTSIHGVAPPAGVGGGRQLDPAAAHLGGYGMLGGLGGANLPQLQLLQLQQLQQQPQQCSPATLSPVQQQLQALGGMQAAAAAAVQAQLGAHGPQLLGGGLVLPPPQQPQLQQPDALLAAAAAASTCPSAGPYGTAAMLDCGTSLAELQGAQLALNAPRLPNAGGYRRHSWAPTTVNDANAYALLLQQQQQQLAALGGVGAAAPGGNGRSLLGMGPGGRGYGAKQRNGYTSGASAALLNGSGLAPGNLGGLSASLAAQLGGLQGGMLAPAGYDVAAAPAASFNEQQQIAHRLLQLQQQATRAAATAAQRAEPAPFVNGLADASRQAGGLDTAGMLPGLAAAAATGVAPFVPPPVAPALLPAALAAATHLSSLGVDADGLGAAAAAAAANMYAPLQVGGVTLDSQLLVSPFADNWDMQGSQGIPGLTPQQLASASAAVQLGYAGKPPAAALAGAGGAPPLPLAGGHSSNGNANGNSHAHGKDASAKPLAARSGSVSSNASSNASSGNGQQHGKGSAGAAACAAAGGAGAAASAAPAAAEAALAAASAAAAAQPPLPKVCSDAPWDLKKAAEEDAKVLAAQRAQVDKLLAALQRSKTLKRAAQARAAAASPDAAKTGRDASDAPAQPQQQVLFGYQLPDTGADAWSGSGTAPPTTAAAAPGSGCISEEPSNKLFVGNIGWWVTEEALLAWFSRFGSVVNVKVRPGRWGRARCLWCRVPVWSCGLGGVAWQRSLAVAARSCRAGRCNIASHPCDNPPPPPTHPLTPTHTHTDHVQLAQDAQAQGQVAQPRVRLHRLRHARGGRARDCVDGRRRAARPDEGHVRHHRAVRQAHERQRRQRRPGRGLVSSAAAGAPRQALAHGAATDASGCWWLGGRAGRVVTPGARMRGPVSVRRYVISFRLLHTPTRLVAPGRCTSVGRRGKGGRAASFQLLHLIAGCRVSCVYGVCVTSVFAAWAHTGAATQPRTLPVVASCAASRVSCAAGVVWCVVAAAVGDAPCWVVCPSTHTPLITRHFLVPTHHVCRTPRRRHLCACVLADMQSCPVRVHAGPLLTRSLHPLHLAALAASCRVCTPPGGVLCVCVAIAVCVVCMLAAHAAPAATPAAHALRCAAPCTWTAGTRASRCERCHAARWRAPVAGVSWQALSATPHAMRTQLAADARAQLYTFCSN